MPNHAFPPSPLEEENVRGSTATSKIEFSHHLRQATLRHVQRYVESMQCHIHMHIAATYFNIGNVENGLLHIGSGVEMQSVGNSALPAHAVMWQFRIRHTPKRKKLLLLIGDREVSAEQKSSKQICYLLRILNRTGSGFLWCR